MLKTSRRTAPSVTSQASEWILPHLPAVTPLQFVACVTAAAIASVVLPATWTAARGDWLPAFVVLTLLSAFLEFQSVRLPIEGDLSVATIGHVAAILLVPPPFAAISVGLAILVEELVHRRSLARLAFNVASYVLTVSMVSGLIGAIESPWEAARDHHHLQLVAVFAIAAGGYYLVNTLVVSGIVSLSTGRSYGYILRGNMGNTLLTELGAATIGGTFALIWTVEPLWTLTLAIPAWVINSALGYIRKLETETKTAVRELAQTLDHRDRSTHHHSERVSGYARALATEMGLPDDTVEVIAEAAGVHDLGKIGIPDRVLLKPGDLTESERATMWLHTEIGARILAGFSMFSAGADIVLHHHERFDGRGYPDGLRAEAIPLGARVVAVADAFDAMTEDRPYRAALPVEEAVHRLRDGAGTQWDPLVVGAFLRLVAEDRLPRPSIEEPTALMGAIGLGDVAEPATQLSLLGDGECRTSEMNPVAVPPADQGTRPPRAHAGSPAGGHEGPLAGSAA